MKKSKCKMQNAKQQLINSLNLEQADPIFWALLS